MEYKPKEIICPQCLKCVGTYDGRSTINHVSRCNICGKRIIYHVDTEEIEIKPLTQRTCSSGITFY